MDRDLQEQITCFARAGMQLLPPGKNNLTTAASYIADGGFKLEPTRLNFNGGGGGGGGVPVLTRKI